MIKLIESVEVISETDKFVFFTLCYTEKSYIFLEKTERKDCFVQKYKNKELATPIHICDGESSWWKSRSEWSAVEVWLHKNNNEKLNPLTSVINI